MLSVFTFTSLLLIVAEAKRRKGSPFSGVQPRNLSLPGKQISVEKSYTSFALSSGQFEVFYAVLGIQDALDLLRIHCVITNVRELKNNDLHFLQVTASNGRGSVSFSLPETTSNGTILYEGGRILHPLDVDDFEDGHYQTLTATVHSRYFTDLSINIRFAKYDRSQYDVKLPYVTPSHKFLSNQHAGYVRPLSYRLNTAGAQVLRILIMSDDDLCAQLVVTRSEANPYIRNIDHRMGSDEFLHEMEFTRRLDLLLPRGEVPQVLLMFIFVYSDDARCQPGAAARTPNKLKLFNITWTAEDGISFSRPIAVLAAFYLVPIISALIYAWVVDLSSSRGDLQTTEQSRPMGPSPPPLGDDLSTVATGSDPVGLENELDVSRGTESTMLQSWKSETVALDEVVTRLRDKTVTKAVSTSSQEQWSWSSAQFALVLLPILSLIIAVPSYGPSWSDDNCFHNYACSEPFWIFTSFNHILSNAGYIAGSVVFLIFAKMRKGKLTFGCGTYNNYGLEICMGLSLLCEAFASSIYHLCPNSVTYNLDTPFIEVLCVLIILKMYGNRRATVPARTANMAALLVIFVDSIVTMFAQRALTRILIIICLPLLVLFGMAKVLKSELPSGFRRNPSKGLKKSLAFSIGAIIVNILLAVAFILPADRIQPNQIVTVICLTNTSLYFLYYIFKKFNTGEQLCEFSRVSSAVAAILWAIALYFFLTEETNWAMSKRELRTIFFYEFELGRNAAEPARNVNEKFRSGNTALKMNLMFGGLPPVSSITAS